MDVKLIAVRSGSRLEDVRSLFREYAESLDFSLCFQGFDRELEDLPGEYAPPRGRLLLARVDAYPVGCVALRPESDDAAEMKRLFVRPSYRGQKIGRVLAEAACQAAREIGYRRVRLDTVSTSMQAAIAMYESMGFRDIAPYRENPIEGARYLELGLCPAGGF